VKTNYVLIDYENVQVKSLALLKDAQFRVRVFLGPKNTKLPVELVLAMHELSDQAEYIVLETPGANALDFQIAYYLGELATADPEGFFHIISKDSGFDPLIAHLKTRKIFAARSNSVEEMPCFRKAPATAKLPNNPTENDEVKPASAPVKVSSLIKVAVDDLIKRKASKPRTLKTLKSTIHARCGKQLPLVEIEAVYDALVKRGYVKANGEKITYALPVS